MATVKFDNIGTLELKTVKLGQLYLDPNNPRFMGVESKNVTLENRFTNKKVQERALKHMQNYGLNDLKANIEEVGFLPIDKMVFAEIAGLPDEYYCLEGNRRLACLRLIMQDCEAGEIDLRNDVIDSIATIEIYVLKEKDRADRAKNIIQGVRHMSGVKDWRPYQKAKLIDELIKDGKPLGEIAKMFGTNTQTVKRYFRGFCAFEQFRDDDTYGEFWHPELFRMFDDVIRRPRLRDEWLGWDEEKKQFGNTTDLEYFYSWIIPNSGTRERKIPGANYIKDLDVIVNNPQALDYLKNEGTTLTSALSIAREMKKNTSLAARIEQALEVIKSIKVDELADLNEHLQDKLVELIRLVKKVLELKK